MLSEKFSFKLLKEMNSSRLGKIFTRRGNIDRPAFMPVGTQATVKSTFIDDVNLTGSQIILCNTYHLMIRPGHKRIKRIAVMDQDGANVRFLTDGKNIVIKPMFSPSSDSILYTSYKSGVPRVYKKDLKTGKESTFKSLPGMNFSPRFSPYFSQHFLTSFFTSFSTTMFTTCFTTSTA